MNRLRWEASLRFYEAQIGALSTHLMDPEKASAFDMSLICLYSKWEQFLREYLLHKAAIETFSNGKPTRSRKNACLKMFLASKAKMKREPNWGVPVDAIDFSRSMALRDHPSILSVLGVTPWLLDDLRHLRNFLAHRSEEAAIKFMQKSNPTSKEFRRYALDIVDVVKGTQRYNQWVGEMKLINSLLP